MVICEDLSADILIEKVTEQLGRYENRARSLRRLVGDAVQRHFALAGADRVTLEQDGQVLLSNVELRNVVRSILRRQDLRQPFTVQQCREAIISSRGLLGDLSSLGSL